MNYRVFSSRSLVSTFANSSFVIH